MLNSENLNERWDTKSRILSAAASKFRESGYAAVSLRDIAKSAGLTTGSLYYHYGSKDEVVEEILKLGHTNIGLAVKNAISECADDAPSEERVRCAVKAHIMCLFGSDSLPSANIKIFAQVPANIVSASMPSRREYENQWKELLEEAKKEGFLKSDLDVELAVPLIFGAMNWTLEWFDTDKHDLEKVVAQVVALLSAS